jgi:hypothetical protein
MALQSLEAPLTVIGMSAMAHIVARRPLRRQPDSNRAADVAVRSCGDGRAQHTNARMDGR